MIDLEKSTKMFLTHLGSILKISIPLSHAVMTSTAHFEGQS
jgi:hypothetical protein